ncbi:MULTISPECIES: outer membrane beta-barrel protein [Tenacibaculum]|uniref:outer membrane beta-barrel protein n=1 Tax=Tenacibaculum TaxID=104267 RepID=UPI000898579E|nr:outer membrane beta-barrel protein [Tenacibaculum sp. MAR_2010_89]SEE20062.1 Outer membrane receptor proteins, mostly Fe transport [Tenacibaculum sp. MAR_2010_89]
MKLLTTTLLLFFIITTTFSQHSISGKVIDQNNTTVPFANVILKEKKGNKTPKGTVTDENGNYKFENISSNTYQIEISVLGFKIEKSKEFKLDSNKTLNFTLKEESQTLNEVVIKSKRPVIKQTAEKLIVDLEKTEMVNSSLQDVMRKVPGVLVTNSGITIAGKSGVRILINGKTTEYMDVDTLLRDFPADNISKVEVVEQPGAEYDASGSGAIINIILKKNVSLGTHGSVMGWIGEDEGFEYGTRASIASYKNKLNWQTSISHSQPTWRDDLFLVRTVGNETYDQATKEPYNPNRFTVSGSLDYYINDKNSIGIGGRWNNRKSDRIASSKTIISRTNTTDILFSENSFDRDRVDFNINPYYEYKSDTDKLLIDFNYIDYKNDNTNTLSDVPGSTIPFQDRRYLQDGKYTIKTYRIDYNKTFSDNFKLSIGSKYAMVNTDSDLKSFLENNTGTFDFDQTNSSQFLVNENIFAIYSKINANYGKWSFSGGLRFEDSNTDGTSVFLKNGQMVTELKKRPISKLFPSASISRKITEEIGSSLSYSYRIRRPSYNSLNSFATYLDPFSAGEGNPALKPAFTNNYQFNLTYKGQPFFTVGYSKTNDVIFDLIKQDNSNAQIRQQAVNVENFTNWNFRLFGPLNFIKGVEGYTGFIVNKNSYNSIIHGVDLSKWNLFWFIQASYKLPWDVNFEMSGNYGTGALQGQIDVDWLAGLDFSLGKKFLDDKLKVNLGFNKMLNRGFNGTIDYGNGTAKVESNGSRQNIQLRLTYSFGSKFGKKKSKRNSSRDEENRIQDNN